MNVYPLIKRSMKLRPMVNLKVLSFFHERMINISAINQNNSAVLNFIDAPLGKMVSKTLRSRNHEIITALVSKKIIPVMLFVIRRDFLPFIFRVGS